MSKQEPESYRKAGNYLDYEVISFTEKTYLTGAYLAQKIQAQSYLDQGYVLDSAIDSDGRLFEDIDSSRGDNVEYYLANDGYGRSHASVRISHIPEGGSIDDLSSYWHTKEVLFQESLDYLDKFISESGTKSIKDCSAIAKLPESNPLATYVAVRQALQDSIQSGRREVWVMALTKEAFVPLKDSFGEAMWRSGNDVSPNITDSRISNKTRLVPAIAEIWMVPQRLLESILSAETEEAKQKFIRTLHLVASGLKDEELSDNSEVVATIRSYFP